jgi:2-polyprenyl-3-methyl-5-hydroxy-6-metoxy-1,4-benzoquinol methylase
MQHLDSCLVCGASSQGAKVVHQRPRDQLVRCASCGLVFANPQFTDEELVDLYRTEYYDEERNLATDFREKDFVATQPLHQTTVNDLLRRYPRLRPHQRRRVRVLDFGSGVGFFLHACREAGLDPLGIDFSEVASQVAKQRFSLEVRTEPDRALAELPEGAFDLVTAWQVIEHLRRPRPTLFALVRALAPGGVLCLGVPNLGCWRYRLEGGKWFNIRNQTHLAFYDRKNLSMLLDEAGLVRVTRPVFWGGRGEFGLAANVAQYLVRAANLGSDLRLYCEKPASSS